MSKWTARIGIGVLLLAWAAAVAAGLWMALGTEDEKARAAWISGSVALATAFAGALTGAISATRQNRHLAARDLADRRRTAYDKVIDAAIRYQRYRELSAKHWAASEDGDLSSLARETFRRKAWSEHDHADLLAEDLLPAIAAARHEAKSGVATILDEMEAALKASADDETPPHVPQRLSVEELQEAVRDELSKLPAT